MRGMNYGGETPFIKQGWSINIACLGSGPMNEVTTHVPVSSYELQLWRMKMSMHKKISHTLLWSGAVSRLGSLNASLRVWSWTIMSSYGRFYCIYHGAVGVDIITLLKLEGLHHVLFPPFSKWHWVGFPSRNGPMFVGAINHGNNAVSRVIKYPRKSERHSVGWTVRSVISQ